MRSVCYKNILILLLESPLSITKWDANDGANNVLPSLSLSIGITILKIFIIITCLFPRYGY